VHPAFSLVFIRCKPITADLYDYIEFELVQYRYYSYSQHAGYEKPHHLKLTRVNRRSKKYIHEFCNGPLLELQRGGRQDDQRNSS